MSQQQIADEFVGTEFDAQEAERVGWQPPEDEQAVAAPVPAARQVMTHEQGEQYMLDRNAAAAQYLKNLPAGAKKMLASKRRAKERDQRQREKTDRVATALADSVKQRQVQGKSQTDTVELDLDRELELEADRDPAARNYDLTYDREQDTACIKGNQLYFLVSYLRKEKGARQRATRDWYRIWGACSSLKDVKRTLEWIREENPYAAWWDIHLVPAGGWAPWPPRPDDAERQEYLNDEMNSFMTSHMENLSKALKHDRERQKEMQSREDINETLNKQRAAEQEHANWLRAMKRRAKQLGVTVDEVIEQDAKEGALARARGEMAEPQWKYGVESAEPAGDDGEVEYREVTNPDGTVDVLKVTRKKKRVRREQQQQDNERQLLQQIGGLSLQVESFKRFLMQNNVPLDAVPQLTQEQLQAANEPREQQLQSVLASAKQNWRQEEQQRRTRRRK